jgi:RecG-like helicase
VLLATSYVEHGPTVPNATVMIVEYAEQFDLVRLHRLRGHVGNGWRRGACLLVRTPEGETEEARMRLDLLLKETDGFRIAELDLRHRGLDVVLGERAADAPDFVWADPVSERDLLLKTRQEAMRLLALDPGLKRRSHRGLLHLVRARFGDDVGGDPDERPRVSDTSGGAKGGDSSGNGGGNAGRRRRRRRGR